MELALAITYPNSNTSTTLIFNGSKKEMAIRAVIMKNTPGIKYQPQTKQKNFKPRPRRNQRSKTISTTFYFILLDSFETNMPGLKKNHKEYIK